MTPSLIGIDWGTTSLRAYLIGAGDRVLERIEAPRGILAIEGGRFQQALDDAIAPWRQGHGPLPVLMSGMIGSRQGWAEAPYCRLPAGLAELAGSLHAMPGGRQRIAIVAGVASLPADAAPDVMRGEETQVLGALAAMRLSDGLFVLPGTHSKWVTVVDGRITAFKTYMTGEVFAAMKDHTILGRLMADGGTGGEGFVAGIAASGKMRHGGDLLSALFSVRTLGLFERLPGDALADYLSGLLIGAEVRAAVAAQEGPVTIVASPALTARYDEAVGQLGVTADSAPRDCVAIGLAAVARAAGWGEP